MRIVMVSIGIQLRSELLEQAARLDTWPLALVTAPGGYGKSTLLRAWRDALRARGRAVASLVLASLHEDPGLFVEDLIDAIRDALGEREAANGPEGFGAELLRRLAPVAADASHPGRPGATGQRLARLLLRSLHDLVEPIILIFDDYHCLPRGCPADVLVDALVAGAEDDGPNLVIASRGDVPATAARLAAEGRALELGAADLSLRANQVSSLLAQRLADDEILQAEVVPLVLAQTGGWAMGVLLAARALARRSGEEPRRVIGELGRGDALFASLAEGLLEQEPPETLALLESAALLGPVPRASLFEALRELTDPEAALRDAAEKGLVSTVDGEVAVHPLWQELLLERLRRRGESEGLADSVRRAAEILEQLGEAPRAAELCHSLGLRDELGALLESHGLAWVERGQHASVARWLAAARRENEERADFHLLEGLLEARHDPAAGLAALDRAALLFHRAGRHDRELATLHNIVIVAANEGRPEDARSAVLRLLGLRRLLSSSEARGVAVLFGAMAAFLRGRYRIARRLADRATGYSYGPRERGALAIGRCQLAFLTGEWRESLRAAEDVLGDSDQRLHGPSFFSLRALRAFARGVLDLDREQALAQLRGAGEALGELRMRITEAECAHFIARLLLAEERFAEAVPKLKRGLAIFDEVGDEDGRIGSHALLAHAAWLLGDEEEASAQARIALEAFRGGEGRGRLRRRFWYAAMATRTLAESGAAGEADRFARAHARTFDVPDLPLCQHVAQLALARAAWLAGDEPRALRHLERAAQAERKIDAPSPEVDAPLAAWVAERARAAGAELPRPRPERADLSVLRIETFGGLRVWLDGLPVDEKRWRGNTARRLLLRLLCAEGRTIERERLAAELWPDAEPARARGNLRVALSRLRRVLEPEREAGEPEAWLALEGDGVALSRRALATWDVHAWRSAAAEAERARAAGEGDGAHALALDAVELFEGPFAPDVFDDWALDLRGKLEEELLSFGRPAAEAELREHPETACQLAQKLVEQVPADEGAWLLLVRAWLARGDRAAALRAASRAEEALRRELDLEASAELRALTAEARSSG